jgi:hypothetical protein
MAEWDTNGCFDDPFVVSGDVFGRNVGDVDVWKANDSFGGDQEWRAFNVSDDDMPPEESAPKSLLKGQEQPKSSTDSVKDEDKKKRRSKSKSGSSSSREKSEISKQSSPSSSHSRSNKREKTTKSSSLCGFFDSTTKDGEDGVPGHESSSGSTRSTSEEFQGRSRHNRVPMSPRGSPRTVVESTKPRSAPRRRPTDSNHLPSASNHLLSASNHLPSASNHSSNSRTSRDLQNGTSSNHRSRAYSPSTRGDWNLEGAPRTPSKVGRPRRAASDDALASSYRTFDRRVLSSSSRTELVRQKNGSVQPQRPRDRARRVAQSNNRRDSVKDSLNKFLEDDAPPDTPAVPDTPPTSRRGHTPSLLGFLHRQDSFCSEEGSTGMGSTGVQSAPPSMGLSSPLPPSSRDVKSRRWSKKMQPPPSPKKQSTAIGVKIAQEGYIEVVDGKMRLVFDVPTD